MNAASGASQELPPRHWQHRLWGLSPRAVESWAEDVWRQYLQEMAPLLTELKTLRHALGASEAVAREATGRADAAEARVAALEAEGKERDLRYRAMRDDALGAVADAWAQARAIEEQTRLTLEQAHAQWRDEEVRLQRERDRVRQEWETVLTELRGAQLKAVDGTQALAQDLLALAEALRARVPDEGTASSALPQLDYYWHDGAGAARPTAGEADSPIADSEAGASNGTPGDTVAGRDPL